MSFAAAFGNQAADNSTTCGQEARKYLDQTLKTLVAAAMKEAVLAQPSDPLAFIARYLKANNPKRRVPPEAVLQNTIRVDVPPPKNDDEDVPAAPVTPVTQQPPPRVGKARRGSMAPLSAAKEVAKAAAATAVAKKAPVDTMVDLFKLTTHPVTDDTLPTCPVVHTHDPAFPIKGLVNPTQQDLKKLVSELGGKASQVKVVWCNMAEAADGTTRDLIFLNGCPYVTDLSRIPGPPAPKKAAPMTVDEPNELEATSLPSAVPATAAGPALAQQQFDPYEALTGALPSTLVPSLPGDVINQLQSVATHHVSAHQLPLDRLHKSLDLSAFNKIDTLVGLRDDAPGALNPVVVVVWGGHGYRDVLTSAMLAVATAQAPFIIRKMHRAQAEEDFERTVTLAKKDQFHATHYWQEVRERRERRDRQREVNEEARALRVKKAKQAAEAAALQEEKKKEANLAGTLSGTFSGTYSASLQPTPPNGVLQSPEEFAAFAKLKQQEQDELRRQSLMARQSRRRREDITAAGIVDSEQSNAATKIQAAAKGCRVRAQNRQFVFLEATSGAQIQRSLGKLNKSGGPGGDHDANKEFYSGFAITRRTLYNLCEQHECLTTRPPTRPLPPRKRQVWLPHRKRVAPSFEDDVSSEEECWTSHEQNCPRKPPADRPHTFNPSSRIERCAEVCPGAKEFIAFPTKASAEFHGVSVVQRRAYVHIYSHAFHVLHAAFVEMKHREELQQVGNFEAFVQNHHWDVLNWASHLHAFSLSVAPRGPPTSMTYGAVDVMMDRVLLTSEGVPWEWKPEPLPIAPPTSPKAAITGVSGIGATNRRTTGSSSLKVEEPALLPSSGRVHRTGSKNQHKQTSNPPQQHTGETPTPKVTPVTANLHSSGIAIAAIHRMGASQEGSTGHSPLTGAGGSTRSLKEVLKGAAGSARGSTRSLGASPVTQKPDIVQPHKTAPIFLASDNLDSEKWKKAVLDLAGEGGKGHKRVVWISKQLAPMVYVGGKAYQAPRRPEKTEFGGDTLRQYNDFQSSVQIVKPGERKVSLLPTPTASPLHPGNNSSNPVATNPPTPRTRKEVQWFGTAWLDMEKRLRQEVIHRIERTGTGTLKCFAWSEEDKKMLPHDVQAKGKRTPAGSPVQPSEMAANEGGVKGPTMTRMATNMGGAGDMHRAGTRSGRNLGRSGRGGTSMLRAQDREVGQSPAQTPGQTMLPSSDSTGTPGGVSLGGTPAGPKSLNSTVNKDQMNTFLQALDTESLDALVKTPKAVVEEVVFSSITDPLTAAEALYLRDPCLPTHGLPWLSHLDHFVEVCVRELNKGTKPCVVVGAGEKDHRFFAALASLVWQLCIEHPEEHIPEPTDWLAGSISGHGHRGSHASNGGRNASFTPSGAPSGTRSPTGSASGRRSPYGSNPASRRGSPTGSMGSRHSFASTTRDDTSSNQEAKEDPIVYVSPVECVWKLISELCGDAQEAQNVKDDMEYLCSAPEYAALLNVCAEFVTKAYCSQVDHVCADNVTLATHHVERYGWLALITLFLRRNAVSILETKEMTVSFTQFYLQHESSIHTWLESGIDLPLPPPPTAPPSTAMLIVEVAVGRSASPTAVAEQTTASEPVPVICRPPHQVQRFRPTVAQRWKEADFVGSVL